MTTEVHVPALPESVADATVLEWHKAPGDLVRSTDNLLELETDKVVLEVPAPCDGVLREILVQSGETVSAGTLLARIDETARQSASATTADAAPVHQPVHQPEPSQPLENKVTTDQPEARRTEAELAKLAQDLPEQGKPAPQVAPGARRLIKELALDAARIPGSGRDGRIHKADVLAWLDRHEATEPDTDADQSAFASAEPEVIGPASPPPESRSTPDHESRPQQRVPMTRLRARIAERLLEAQRQSAALTTFNEADLSAVIRLRAGYREDFERQHGVRLGIMSIFVKAAVAALQQFPVLNATIDGSDMLYRGFYDIGIAVSTERGLVVPILRDCDRLSLADIEHAIASFGRKARDGHLSVEDLTGGTFSITNGGVFGSLLSTPIINPPQSAILGMHKIEDRPVAINGQVEIRPMMYLALSYDHRLIDGRDAVRFLVAIKQTIEDPTRLLLNL